MKDGRQRRCPFALALLAMHLLSGCAKVRYPTSYILNFPPPVLPAVTVEAALGPVAVNEFKCPDYLCEGRIVYRPSPEEVAFYEYHRRAMNPRQSITKFIADSLRAQSIFRYVGAHEHGAGAAYVLSGNIERFEEVDQGRDVHVVCAISAQLIDAKTGSVVWTGAASETVPVKDRNIAGVVRSFTAAAHAAVDRLVKSMATQLAPG